MLFRSIYTNSFRKYFTKWPANKTLCELLCSWLFSYGSYCNKLILVWDIQVLESFLIHCQNFLNSQLLYEVLIFQMRVKASPRPFHWLYYKVNDNIKLYDSFSVSMEFCFVTKISEHVCSHVCVLIIPMYFDLFILATGFPFVRVLQKTVSNLLGRMPRFQKPPLVLLRTVTWDLGFKSLPRDC